VFCDIRLDGFRLDGLRFGDIRPDGGRRRGHGRRRVDRPERQGVQHGPDHGATAIDARLLSLQLKAAVAIADRSVDAVRNPAATAFMAVHGPDDPLIRHLAFQKEITALGAGHLGFGADLSVEELPQTALRNHVQRRAVEAPVSARHARANCIRLNRRLKGAGWGCKRLRRAGGRRVLCHSRRRRRFGLRAAAGAGGRDRGVARADAAFDQHPDLRIAGTQRLVHAVDFAL
jgi:hypothetical protein